MTQELSSELLFHLKYRYCQQNLYHHFAQKESYFKGCWKYREQKCSVSCTFCLCTGSSYDMWPSSPCKEAFFTPGFAFIFHVNIWMLPEFHPRTTNLIKFRPTLPLLLIGNTKHAQISNQASCFFNIHFHILTENF